MTLRLGVIGLSRGNGHPYSWSAIFNGYEPEPMADCGFPVIPAYLAEQSWPEARILAGTVTHVWTQDLSVSVRVSEAARIPHIVKDPTDMIGQIDALLLARDDAQNHYQFATPFLDAGLPVYIDKPIALNLVGLDRLYSHQHYDGQIFTGSALRYGREFQLSEEDRRKLGPIRMIRGVIPKAWDTYAIHLIDPVLNIVGHAGKFDTLSHHRVGQEGAALTVQREDGLILSFTVAGCDIAAPLTLSVHGETGSMDLHFKDSFTAFKMALQDFIDGIRSQTVRSDPAFNRACVSLIERGRPNG